MFGSFIESNKLHFPKSSIFYYFKEGNLFLRKRFRNFEKKLLQWILQVLQVY
ncbi:hypothetical protein NU09_2032 [Flavobacterium beibuense]|uniref:Uncharacterized protein n=1 Tax=Flavobacterium beibuense TaxID=657326 RepID=A0A444WAV2_9FLAO|nr:hypothetical protein NU09_2032 [Flavobacterium beibuense]